jgi:TonB family protein
VSLRTMRMWLGSVVLAAAATAVVLPPFQAAAQVQEEAVTRKIKTRVTPLYPEIARRMAITGKVKLSVVISPNGTIKDAKVIGGHPILVNAAMDAVKKWKYEPATGESSGTVEITFAGQQ